MRPMTRKELGDTVALLISQERNKTHGDPHVQFMVAQNIKDLMHSALDNHGEASFAYLGSTQQEALDMIAVKISRLIVGGNLQDHWLDIAGYALIAAEGAESPLMVEDK